jgi:hypothetical protein
LIVLASTTCSAFAQVCNQTFGTVTVNPNLLLFAEPGPLNGDILTNGNLQIPLGFGVLNTQGTEDWGFGPGITIFSDGTPSNNDPYRQNTRDPNVFAFDYPDGSKAVYTSGRPSSLTDAAGRTTTITYSPGTNIPTSIVGPSGTALATFELTSLNIGYGRQGTRISKILYPGGDFVTCTYDNGGNLLSIVSKDGSAVLTLERDRRDPRAVVRVTTPDGQTMIFYEKRDGYAPAVVKIISVQGVVAITSA